MALRYCVQLMRLATLLRLAHKQRKLHERAVALEVDFAFDDDMDEDVMHTEHSPNSGPVQNSLSERPVMVSIMTDQDDDEGDEWSRKQAIFVSSEQEEMEEQEGLSRQRTSSTF